MMKLIIQIPCFNEEATLRLTSKFAKMVKKGIDRVETLIIDDGSTDRTIDIAKEQGVDYIIVLPRT